MVHNGEYDSDDICNALFASTYLL